MQMLTITMKEMVEQQKKAADANEAAARAALDTVDISAQQLRATLASAEAMQRELTAAIDRYGKSSTRVGFALGLVAAAQVMVAIVALWK